MTKLSVAATTQAMISASSRISQPGVPGIAVLHQADDGPAGQRADHQDLAVREIDEVDDAVHHGVAQGYQGVHAAENQTVDDLLQQDFHNENPYL